MRNLRSHNFTQDSTRIYLLKAGNLSLNEKLGRKLIPPKKGDFCRQIAIFWWPREITISLEKNDPRRKYPWDSKT